MRYVRGLITDSKIVVQADHTRLSVAQIAEHEIYNSAAELSLGTNWYCEQKIKEKYGEEEFNKVVEKYIEKLREIIDIFENGTEAEIEEALNAIKEEIFADAYAGINAFGAHAEKYRSEVRQTVEERSEKGRAQKAPETRGPPEKYSIDEIQGKNGDYGQGVILDTPIFKDVKPRNWGKVLGNFVYENLAGKELTMYDKEGKQKAYIWRMRETG